ncbi:cyclin-dependent kinase 9-like [Pagrus major]|uniref:cyclin-dependent kinase 9-like n=1 Tax=Pagrus major TaxID=143350 RepID=UPI003CC8D479
MKRTGTKSHIDERPPVGGSITLLSLFCPKDVDGFILFFLLIVLEATQFNRYKGSIYLVFDFCEHDLAGLLSNANVKFTLAEIKKVMQMLLNGLYYIHRNKILHRDMKAANVLITRDGVLKLADFGLARAFSLAKNSQGNRYTNRVVTLWYRPPELLLGERDYGPPIDLWGGGCIMAEMWTRSPIMQGNTEQHQLTLISQLCGSITAESGCLMDDKKPPTTLLKSPEDNQSVLASFRGSMFYM